MPNQLVNIKTVDIKNNCPECFSTEGLQLTFKQRFIDTTFYKSVTNEVSTDMNCTLCETQIYPARWTDDIERVYNYQMKAFTPKKASKKYKTIFWVLLSAIILVCAVVIFLVLKNAT